jgi:hypothetical protein
MIPILPLLFESPLCIHNPVLTHFRFLHVQIDLLFVIILSKVTGFGLCFESAKVSILLLLIVLCLSGLAWDEGGQLLILTSGEEVVKWNSKNRKLSRLVISC